MHNKAVMHTLLKRSKFEDFNMSDGLNPISLTTFPATISLSPSEIIEKVQLTDHVSIAERAQIVEWFREQNPEMFEKIDNINEFIENIYKAIANIASPEAANAVLKIIENLLT